MSLLKDWSVSASVAGFVAALVGFTSSVAIVFEAARQLGATQAQMSSWMWALGLGMGLCSALPSLWLRMPVMVAWSTPGAALLATAAATAAASGHPFSMPQAIGAFLICGTLITASGLTGWFERFMGRIPLPIASGLLAGVLARFGMDAFLVTKSDAGLLMLMLTTYLLGRRLWPRYTVPVVLLLAMCLVAFRGQLQLDALQWSLAVPVLVMPEFSLSAAISLALPLFIVTMASQNLPGVAAIKAAGYDTMPISNVMTLTGLATLLLAPFGAFALNLSAITASICMGREAHEDPSKRYPAAVICGLIYLVMGLFGAAVASLLAAFPRELVVAIAGLALLGTIASGLEVALRDPKTREAALITFLVTLSGITLLSIGAALWGLVAGALALLIQQWKPAQHSAQR